MMPTAVTNHVANHLATREREVADHIVIPLPNGKKVMASKLYDAVEKLEKQLVKLGRTLASKERVVVLNKASAPLADQDKANAVAGSILAGGLLVMALASTNASLGPDRAVASNSPSASTKESGRPASTLNQRSVLRLSPSHER